MIVLHKKTNNVIANKVRYVNTAWGRMLGLMFIKEMKGFDGLILDPANSVHNCFVRFPIDVVFLNSENRIVKIIRNFKPWRFSWIYFKSRRVLEIKGGSLSEDIDVGDELEVRDV